jgi:hypothetical protein
MTKIVLDKEMTMKNTLAAVIKIKQDILPFKKTIDDLSLGVDNLFSKLEDVDESLNRYADVEAIIDRESREMKISIFQKLFRELYPDMFINPNKLVNVALAVSKSKKKKKR